MTPQQKETAQAALNTAIKSVERFAEGHNTALYRLNLDDGRMLCAKAVRPHQAGQLDVEGWMLHYLSTHSQLPVPAVYHAAPDLLVMDYAREKKGHHKNHEEEAARLIAQLHLVRGEQFGLECDTLLGPLHQPNPQSPDWVSFFVEHRLLYMARQAHGEGRITADLLRRLEILAEKLPGILPATQVPRLIHGDIWRGNIIAGPGGIAAFIDPGVYYADPEIELAFIILFRTFSKRFFDAYHEIVPIAPEFFDIRRHIYNLYPLLAHVRIHGKDYVDGVEKTLKFLSGL